MPEWLLKKDNYTSPKDKDAFIDKSILTLLSVITKIKFKTVSKGNRFRINAFVKLISCFALILMVSLSRSIAYVAVIDVFELIIISILDADDIKHIFKTSSVAAIFTLIIFIPSVLVGNVNNSLMIVLKVFTSVTLINILACITNSEDIVGALKVFFIPDIFIFVIDITIKYIIILSELTLNMLYALKIRSVGTNKDKHKVLSGITGTMFIKSKEMSEELYNAMECRGFTGEYKCYRRFRFSIYDYLYIIINILFVVAFSIM